MSETAATTGQVETAAPHRETSSLPEPGMHYNVPAEVYHSWPFFSNSRAGTFVRHCPAVAHHDKDEEPTAAQMLGTATHSAILEPAVFAQYVRGGRCQGIKASDGEQCTKNSIVARIQGPGGVLVRPTLRTFCRQHDPGGEDIDREVVAASDYDAAALMGRAVHAGLAESMDGQCHSLLTAPGRNEVSLVCDHPVKLSDGETHLVRTKNRIDRLTTVGGFSTLIDVKTAKSASAEEFAKSVGKWGYHRQAAMYLDGMNREDERRGLPSRRRRYIFLVIESIAPYAVAVYELDDESIRAGRSQYQRIMEQWAECQAGGSWPGYVGWHGGIETISAPAWAM